MIGCEDCGTLELPDTIAQGYEERAARAAQKRAAVVRQDAPDHTEQLRIARLRGQLASQLADRIDALDTSDLDDWTYQGLRHSAEGHREEYREIARMLRAVTTQDGLDRMITCATQVAERSASVLRMIETNQRDREREERAAIGYRQYPNDADQDAQQPQQLAIESAPEVRQQPSYPASTMGDALVMIDRYVRKRRERRERNGQCQFCQKTATHSMRGKYAGWNAVGPQIIKHCDKHLDRARDEIGHLGYQQFVPQELR
jgi:hypothetical protein